jgi:hypothetical protein
MSVTNSYYKYQTTESLFLCADLFLERFLMLNYF